MHIAHRMLGNDLLKNVDYVIHVRDGTIEQGLPENILEKNSDYDRGLGN